MSINRISILCLILLVVQNVSATELLIDQITYQGYKGNIFPSECCWLKKPKSKELSRIERNNIEKRTCTAIGGPVSKLELVKDKLYLTSLYQCGGDLPLSEVYPELKQPALAVWLSGTYQASLNSLCLNKYYETIYEFRHTLTVEKGIVTSISTTKNDRTACLPNT